ncbi:MAG: hypothetical protein ACFFA0_04575 [Promethearchaeota archaeon]
MVDFNKISEFFENTPIPQNMLERGQIVLNNFMKPIKTLFEQKNVPQESWSDEEIEFLLETLSNMETFFDNKNYG